MGARRAKAPRAQCSAGTSATPRGSLCFSFHRPEVTQLVFVNQGWGPAGRGARAFLGPRLMPPPPPSLALPWGASFLQGLSCRLGVLLGPRACPGPWPSSPQALGAVVSILVLRAHSPSLPCPLPPQGPARSHPKAWAYSSDGPASASTSHTPGGGRPVLCRSGVCFRPHVLLQPLRGARACFSTPGCPSACWGLRGEAQPHVEDQLGFTVVITTAAPSHEAMPGGAPFPRGAHREAQTLPKASGASASAAPPRGPRGLPWPPHCLRTLSSAQELRAWSLGRPEACISPLPPLPYPHAPCPLSPLLPRAVRGG